ncbi:hypothetical protein ACO22_02927 [Paracoccidioides brasiliensis]|uniref:Uncharacterized protein n=1 Tax=Paracoccidioides brasiliensis TaxID=121759 RepID=A0A1D2JHD7_PARBR|nr:hypothetical protein ACO22_02927 [Paracoccidioides brasiliensis]
MFASVPEFVNHTISTPASPKRWQTPAADALSCTPDAAKVRTAGHRGGYGVGDARAGVVEESSTVLLAQGSRKRAGKVKKIRRLWAPSGEERDD